MTIAFMKAFGAVQGQPPAREEEEPVIDTTDPDFAKTFQRLQC
jgi:hypothetical protein